MPNLRENSTPGKTSTPEKSQTPVGCPDIHVGRVKRTQESRELPTCSPKTSKTMSAANRVINEASEFGLQKVLRP